MPTLDVFNQDAFSAISLTKAINDVPHLPQFLGSLGLFEVQPITTETLMIERVQDTLSLIPTSERGAPPPKLKHDKRNVRDFRTVRVAKEDTIYAHQIQNLRAFGSESELATVQGEKARRDMRLVRDMNLTWENMRLGAIQGVLTDADGSTIYNWFTEMGVTQDDEIDFDLDDATPESGEVRTSCAQVVRQTMDAAKGSWIPGSSYVMGLASDSFFDSLVGHSEVRETYKYQVEASQLRGPQAYQELNYGGIRFVNYRGTDADNLNQAGNAESVNVTTDKCKFFPVGCPDVFQVAFSPAESFDFVNTPGQPLYNMMVTDRDRNMWAKTEMYSYPLFICTKPKMLQRAKLT